MIIQVINEIIKSKLKLAQYALIFIMYIVCNISHHINSTAWRPAEEIHCHLRALKNGFL